MLLLSDYHRQCIVPFTGRGPNLLLAQETISYFLAIVVENYTDPALVNASGVNHSCCFNHFLANCMILCRGPEWVFALTTHQKIGKA